MGFAGGPHRSRCEFRLGSLCVRLPNVLPRDAAPCEVLLAASAASGSAAGAARRRTGDIASIGGGAAAASPLERAPWNPAAEPG